MDVIIIGAGASGLTAGIVAAKKNNNVTILERNNICGKKLLMTGNGRCNYFNENQHSKHYHSSNMDALCNIITPKNLSDVLTFFDRIGIVPKVKNDCYYPYSNQASSVRDALIIEAKKCGVKIINNTFVTNIEKQNKFIITTNNGEFISDKVVISTGSKTYPKTGSDGNGYGLVKKFGHTVNKVLPSLVQLKGNENFFKDWAGVRSDVNVILFENDKFIKEETGEIQLTDYGVSGICVMQLSRNVAIGLDKKKKEKLVINFIPFINNSSVFIEWMDERVKKISRWTIFELLEGVLNYKLVKVLIKCSKIDKEYWDELTDKEKLTLANNIINFSLNITGTNSFDKAQVCSGGVLLEEVNDNLMSLKCKNLYLTGEILDIDGDCGGYNLTLAWLTGIIVGENI